MSKIAEQIREEVEQERKNGAIIFLPSSIVLESFYRPVIEKIWLTDDDLYNAGQWRINYKGLLKLGNAAGIEWHASESRRTDNMNDKLYIAFRAVGLIRKSDGKLYPTAANYDLDFELIKEELQEQYTKKSKDMKGSDFNKETYISYCVNRDWLQKRKHKFALAESGAKARVIRSIIGIQSQYKDKAQITERPFVIVRFVLDHQNPDIKPVMLAAAIGNMSAVYGGAPVKSIQHIDFNSSDSDTKTIDIQPAEPNSFDDMDSAATDFENAGPEFQIKILESLCLDKNYDLQNYIETSGKGLLEMTLKKRIEFFNYLNTLETPAASEKGDQNDTN